MKNIIITIITVEGEYSIKRVFALIAFIVAMLIGIFIAVSDLYLDTKVINSQAKDVFDSLLLFISVLIGMTEVSKKITDK